MDFQSIANLAAGAVLAVIGWFCKSLYDAVETLKKDINAIQVDLPKTYITKNDYRADMLEIKGMLKQIYEKLDGKADRSDIK